MAATGLGVGELHAAALRLVEREVRSELTCWAAIDPETLVISTMVGGQARIEPEFERRLAAAEYSGTEPHTFASLARRRRGVAKLSDLPDVGRRRSVRLHTVWRPLGLDEELRVLFMVDGACWGAAGMVRAGCDFTDRETDFLVAIAPAIASATRLAVRAEAEARATGQAPAVVVLDSRGTLGACTSAAREWKERFDEISPDRFSVMMQVMAGGALASPTGAFRARVRDVRGHWAFLHASPLIGGDRIQVAVVIEPATGDRLLSLLLMAYGLTARERDVCREVISGHPSAEIADHLFISVNTVQDHLKSVFAKVGVGSRGELVARLRPG